MFEAPKKSEIDKADKKLYKEFINVYAENFKMPASNEEWFEEVKQVADKLGYAIDNKAYKEHPENYKGNTAKACEFVRLALTGRKNSPTLFDIMQVLGEEEVTKRLNLSK